MMPFRDRSEAGRRLAKTLAAYKAEKPVILALPRGGVPVAAEVAAVLDAPLDLILVRKIGAPMQPELAIGAVVDGGPAIIVRNEDIIQLAGVSEAEFEAMCAAELSEIERRRGRYLGDRARIEVSDRVTIVIDDGIATGATTRAALRATRVRNPQKLVLAIPVAPTAMLIEMRQEADYVICLEAYERLRAIGWFYEDFTQVTDEQVIAALARSTLATAVKKPAA
jgi:putative phosphoribosyl transferase